jgi:nucleotide-binding universal stress UspA family protein
MEAAMIKVRADKQISLRNILFLTDFSEPSGAALPFAFSIARTYGATVHALHVLLPSPYVYMTPEASTILLSDQEDWAKAKMEKVEAQLKGVPRETMIERGIGVWPVLSEMLKKGDVDLIVLGTRGRTGLEKILLGSSAEEVFRRSPVPILTIGPTVRDGAHNAGRFRCVLFATDLQAASPAAAAYAVSLAQENQARLVLLHVLPKPANRKGDKSDEGSVAEALHRLHELVPAEAELWCRPEALVQHGDPAEQILAAAKENKAELIVLGAHGMEGMAAITSHFARATAYKVIVNAPCPVLTVRCQ